MHEAGAAARDIHELADEIGIHLRDEVRKVQVDIVHSGTEFRRVEVAQVVGVQVLRERRRRNERASALRHLLSVDRQMAVHEHAGRCAVAGAGQHRGPEQRVEVRNVLADEMVELELAFGAPEVVEVQPFAATKVQEARHVADRRVEPDVEVLVTLARDSKAEVG